VWKKTDGYIQSSSFRLFNFCLNCFSLCSCISSEMWYSNIQVFNVNLILSLLNIAKSLQLRTLLIMKVIISLWNFTIVWKKCCFEHMAQFVNMNNEIKSGDKNNFIEWLLFNPKWELFSVISWQEQVAVYIVFSCFMNCLSLNLNCLPWQDHCLNIHVSWVLTISPLMGTSNHHHSDSLSCLTPNENFFQLYHGKNKLHFDEVMVSALY
jgi:hypothetical protein